MLTQGDRTATMRTSDVERQRAADFLRDACAEGRLSADELDERLGEVWVGRTVADLAHAVWDLPGGDEVVPRLGRRGSPQAPAPVAVRRAGPPLVGVALLVVGVFAIVLAMLPGFLALTLLAMLVGLAVAAGVMTVALAPVVLIVMGVAWVVSRLFGRRLRLPPPPQGWGRRGPF